MMDLLPITTERIGHNHLLGRIALATVILAAAITVGAGGVLASPTTTDPLLSNETQFDRASPALDNSLVSDDNDTVSSPSSSVDEFPEADYSSVDAFPEANPVTVPRNAWDRTNGTGTLPTTDGTDDGPPSGTSEPLPLNG